MKCVIKFDLGSIFIVFFLMIFIVEKDEFEIMNLKILCVVRVGDKEFFVKRIKDDVKII